MASLASDWKTSIHLGRNHCKWCLSGHVDKLGPKKNVCMLGFTIPWDKRTPHVHGVLNQMKKKVLETKHAWVPLKPKNEFKAAKFKGAFT